MSFGPPTRVLPGSELPSGYRTLLIEHGLLEPDERLEYFYSGGLFTILEEGNFYTDRRVVSYETVDGVLLEASATYASIEAIDTAFSTGFLDSTVVTIRKTDGEEFLLLLSNEEGGDRAFVEGLQAHHTRTSRL